MSNESLQTHTHTKCFCGKQVTMGKNINCPKNIFLFNLVFFHFSCNETLFDEIHLDNYGKSEKT